ncbi:6-bladed beta-propeller [Chitinophaga caseinilytica]|uniref:6-bladed beta-propeller n=1 Tax=Chitinophaga caseinilytica TaxID=2267521 RepID=A0ABZ2Z5C7_9BACT
MRIKASIPATLLLLVASVYSCKNNKETNVSPRQIFVDNHAKKDTADIAGLIDTVAVIPLIEGADYPVTTPFQLYAFGDKGYILFNLTPSSKQALFFNKDGTFGKVVAKNGIREEDGINFTDSYVDDKGMIVYDFAQCRINIYDNDLQLKEIRKGKKLLHFSHLARIPNSDNYAAFANYNLGNPSATLLNTLTSDLDVDQTFLPYSKPFRNILVLTYNNSFFRHSDSLRFTKHYDPSIYHIDANGMARLYDIRYAEGSMTSAQGDSIITEHLDKFDSHVRTPQDMHTSMFSGFVFPYGTYLENSRYIIFGSMSFAGNKRDGFMSIISKNTLKDTVSAKVMTDGKSLQGVLPPFMGYDHKTDEFLALATGYQLKKGLDPGSPFQEKLGRLDLAGFYLIKVKFK